MVCLALVAHLAAVAVAFAIVYGWSNGVMTIVRGTVPAVLFGHRNYGALLGRLALPSFVAKALAPLALALVLTPALPPAAALGALIAAAILALAAYRLAVRRDSRS